MGAVYPRDRKTLRIGNQLMEETIKNSLENPSACQYIWRPGIAGSSNVKGDREVKTSGEGDETMKKEVLEENPGLSCRALLVMEVSEV